MNTTEVENTSPLDLLHVELVRVERVDDLPVLWAKLQRLKVAEFLDNEFPVHHFWLGDLTFGEVACVWLVYILSQGDHCLNHLQPWAEQHLLTLQALLGKTVRPLDFHDDRLADILDSLATLESWQRFECQLNQHTVRVYDLQASRFRLDSTTANSHSAVTSEDGILQFGHSKDRNDLPQLKVAAAVLDPLGMPVGTLVVPGNCADDPLYLPQIKQTQQTFGSGDKTFIGDCKMAALATRAYLAHSEDFYLCPLGEKQFSVAERQKLIDSVGMGKQTLQAVYRPSVDPKDVPELVAEGFAFDITLTDTFDDNTPDKTPVSVTWTERRWMVRSVAYAQAQQQGLDKRLEKAIQEVQELVVRRQGKRVLSAEELKTASLAVLKERRVEGLLSVEVKTSRQERTVRGYGGKESRVEVDESHQIEVKRNEEAIAAAKAEMGWQVYGTNDLEWSLEGVVWSYRDQYQIERGWARLKGQPLSLTPMYLADETRMVGLVLLLSIGLRVLTLLEWVVREKIEQSKEPLRGLHPGQPGRKNSSPSAQLLLEAFRGISLTVVAIAGQVVTLLTPLNALQQKLLSLWDFPSDLYQRLTSLCFPKPPPTLSER
jgi:transposase